MKFGSRPTSGTQSRRDRSQAGFTLAEVLAALLFMAIVIPVAVQGLQIASRAGTVAERKGEAARVAEKVLNESLVTSNWNKSILNGSVLEGTREYRWTLRSDAWYEDARQDAPHLLSVEVMYSVRNQDYSVRLSTLATAPQ